MTTDTHPSSVAGAPRPGWDDLPSDSSPAAEPPSGPPTRQQRRRARWRTARAWLALLVAVACAVAIGVRQVDQRLERRDQVQLTRVGLVAEPVDISVTRVASVAEILVKAGEDVREGDPVAVVNTIRPAPSGGDRQVRQTLRSTLTGVVGAVPTNVGATLSPGGVVVRVYDPEALAFEAKLDLETTNRVEVGMTGVLGSETTGDLDVVVVSIESSLDVRPGEPDLADVRLEPDDASDVEGLLPGLVFTGYIDERTGS